MPKNDEIKSMEPNWELILSRFYCGAHKQERVIVNRGPGVFVLDCGCAYEMESAFGVIWKNSTDSKVSNPEK